MRRFTFRHFRISLLLTVIFFSLLPAQDEDVVIIDKGTYFDVTINLKSGRSRFDIGRIIFREAVKAVPDLEVLIDSYLDELFSDPVTYAAMLQRVNDIKPQIPQDYLDEMEGMASEVSGGTDNRPGDGMLSEDELFIIQLLADIGRTTQCSGLSVFGNRSATGQPMTGRILDWFDGSQNQLAQFQAVTTVKNGTRSICMIGYLTLVGVVSGFNSCGVFAGILDSPTGEAYTSAGKRSYMIDLRTALENEATVSDVATFLTDPSREYTFNHLMLLSDKWTSGILENNISGSGSNMRRALRTDTSTLNAGITWGFDNAVGVVNAFMLNGNHDNYTGASFNTMRWETFRTEMERCGATVSFEELKEIASFDHGDGPDGQSTGDIYNRGMQQIILFRPCRFGLEVAFKPKSGVLPTDPVFETIDCPFACNPTEITADDTKYKTTITPQNSNYCHLSDKSTVFRFALKQPSSVRAEFFNILGKRIRTIDIGFISAGTHQRNIILSGFPDGQYFYRLHVTPVVR